MESSTNFLFLIITVLLALVLLSFEIWKPSRTYNLKTKKISYITNIVLFIFNNVVLWFLQVTSVYLLVKQFNFSILNLDILPLYILLPISIFILDLSIWYWHKLNHKLNFLWRFHKAHHSERYLNVTSALRFHTGELILSIFFKSIVLLITGIPLWIFLIYESLITIFAMFHHANIVLPNKIQNILSWIIVTPPMHRTHHSTLRHEHDNNYGVIFSFWDKFFKTYNKSIPKEIGLKNINNQNIIKLLSFPFKKK